MRWTIETSLCYSQSKIISPSHSRWADQSSRLWHSRGTWTSTSQVWMIASLHFSWSILREQARWEALDYRRWWAHYFVWKLWRLPIQERSWNQSRYVTLRRRMRDESRPRRKTWKRRSSKNQREIRTQKKKVNLPSFLFTRDTLLDSCYIKIHRIKIDSRSCLITESYSYRISCRYICRCNK